MNTTTHEPARGAAPERLALGINEAAKTLGVSRRTIYVEMDAGRLPSIKVAGRRLIVKADLDAFIASLKSRAA